jgi:hypothetical protein
VAARERALDPLLALQQPVHRLKQLGLLDVAQVELLGQRRLPEAARGRQLGARADQPLHDHRDDQVALATALARDQPLEIERAQHAQHRRHVTVPQRPADLKARVQVDQPPAGELRADALDDLDRQVREVAQVLVPDLALRVAIGAPQQMRRVLLTALAPRLDCGYVS